MTRPILHGESGQSTIAIVLMLSLLLTAVGAAMLITASMEVDISRNERLTEQAMYYADSGLHAAMARVNEQLDQGLDPSADGELLIAETNVPTGLGTTLAAATYRVWWSQAAGTDGRVVQCGVPGYDQTYGRKRFKVISEGRIYGPTSVIGDPYPLARRQVEAIIYSRVEAGVCAGDQGS